jgi:hypothetical protein
MFEGRNAYANGIQDGKDVEHALLGAKFFKGKGEYQPYQVALRQAIANQPPTDKQHPSINHVSKVIASLCDDTTLPVNFYTAVGTSLDIHHGVDALFIQGGVVVTVDASLREKESHKADVLVRAQFKKDGTVYIPDQEIQAVAGRIARLINERRAKRAH